jgi:hypothetical protein
MGAPAAVNPGVAVKSRRITPVSRRQKNVFSIIFIFTGTEKKKQSQKTTTQAPLYASCP